jgi:hypothetical protein
MNTANNGHTMHGLNNGNQNTMDMVKQMLMTVFMIKSTTGVNNTTTSNLEPNFISNILYFFVATQLIDAIMKYLPAILLYIQQVVEKRVRAQKVLQNIIQPGEKIVTSSILIQVNVADHDNLYGQALLDFVTNNENTKHISFRKGIFTLNQTEVIEIMDQVFIRLKENKVTVDDATNTSKTDIEQTLELFSYTKTTSELREFLNKLSYNYNIKIKNKLNGKTYYFNLHPQSAPKMMDGKKDYTKLPNHCVFTMKQFQTNRKFSNLFGPEISVVKKRVDFFVHNKKWYDSKGIPYTLGLLLSGQAGAGKTSSIKCLANETKRHIININLNNDITKIQLENLFFNEVIMVLNIATGQNEKYFIPLDERIYVLEDVDCQSDMVMSRFQPFQPFQPLGKVDPNHPLFQPLGKVDPNHPVVEKVDIKGGYFIPKIDTKVGGLDQPFPKVEKVGGLDQPFPKVEKVGGLDQPFPKVEVEKDVIDSLKLDLSFLLNLLDGVLELPGRIVVMTSNYPEKLDHALIRPGRIDVTADFKKCTNETIIEMLEFFYDIELETSELKSIIQLEEYFISPAELGKWMFETIDDYKICIEKLLKTIPMVLSENTNTYDSQYTDDNDNDNDDELPELILVDDIEERQDSYDTNECSNMFSNFKDFDSFIHILNDLIKPQETKQDTDTSKDKDAERQEARDGENSEMNPYSGLLADFMSAMSKESDSPDFNKLFTNLENMPEQGNPFVSKEEEEVN